MKALEDETFSFFRWNSLCQLLKHVLYEWMSEWKEHKKGFPLVLDKVRWLKSSASVKLKPETLFLFVKWE